MVEIGPLPVRGDEAEHRNQGEEENEDDRRDDVQMIERYRRFPIWSAAAMARAEIGIRKSLNQ